MKKIFMNHGCPFCGQVQAIEVNENATEKEINDAAIKLCICEGAEKHKEMENVRKNIKALFGEESAAKFDDSFSIEVQDDLYGWAEKIYDEIYEKVTVVLENGDKAVIAASGKRIKISREQKVKISK